MNRPSTNERPRGQGGANREHLGSASYLRSLGSLYGTRRAKAPQRKRPPYGREVEEELAQGRHPNVRLYACRPDPWDMARAHRDAFGSGSVLVLPADGDPEAFHWPPLEDVVGIVTGLPGDALQRLAHALVRDGVRLAYLLDAARPDRSLRVKAVQS